MKRLILACGLLGAIATAQAQPAHPGKPPLDAQQRATYLQKSLQLNDDQAAKVKKILESSEQQRKALMDKYKPQFDAMHAEGKALREQTETQISGVLTPKQQEAFKVQREKREGFMHRHMRDHAGMHGPDDDEPAPAD